MGARRGVRHEDIRPADHGSGGDRESDYHRDNANDQCELTAAERSPTSAATMTPLVGVIVSADLARVGTRISFEH
jgi:hypothetical protein